MAISDLIWSPVARARSAVASVAWTPCVGLSQSLIMSLLVKIETGQLRVVDQTGAVTVCGRADVVDGEPHTEIRIHKETFWVRMLLFTDMVGSLNVPFALSADRVRTIPGLRRELHAG